MLFPIYIASQFPYKWIFRKSNEDEVCAHIYCTSQVASISIIFKITSTRFQLISSSWIVSIVQTLLFIQMSMTKDPQYLEASNSNIAWFKFLYSHSGLIFSDQYFIIFLVNHTTHHAEQTQGIPEISSSHNVMLDYCCVRIIKCYR